MTRSLDEVVASLSADLTPVRRLPAPSLRAALWLAIVSVMALLLASFSDLEAVGERLAAAPDMWLAVAGSTLTAVCAAVAAFQLSVPGRGARWALLPLPALALWMSASGMGCLRTWMPAGTGPEAVDETRYCLIEILALSVPLMVPIALMLRRAFPLRPRLTTVVAGLAVAAAAASLLNLVHPYDASADDLVVHGMAVVLVIALQQGVSHRLAAARPSAGLGTPVAAGD